MENEALLEPQTQKLIKIYTTIYKIVFQYSFFIIPLLLWLVAAIFLDSREKIVPKKINEVYKQITYTNTNGMYKPARVSDQIWPILDGIWDVKILGWDLQATWNVIIWRNNIITLQDIVLPNEQYILNFDFSWGVEYFSGNYDVKNLTNEILVCWKAHFSVKIEMFNKQIWIKFWVFWWKENILQIHIWWNLNNNRKKQIEL